MTAVAIPHFEGLEVFEQDRLRLLASGILPMVEGGEAHERPDRGAGASWVARHVAGE